VDTRPVGPGLLELLRSPATNKAVRQRMERTPPLVDIDLPDSHSADDAAPELGSRRRVLGAGFVGLAAALLPQVAGRAGASAPRPGDEPTTSSGAASTTAGPTTTAAPKRPSDADIALLAFAQQVELAAAKLYGTALAGTALGDNAALFTTLKQAHGAYAQSLSGLIGKPAPGVPLDAVLTTFNDGFSNANGTAVAQAAYALEATAIATHEALVGKLAGLDGSTLIASILIAEARHCTVLADLAGSTDLDTLLLSDATALEPTKG
jgi:Ferritin-like domain